MGSLIPSISSVYTKKEAGAWEYRVFTPIEPPENFARSSSEKKGSYREEEGRGDGL